MNNGKKQNFGKENRILSRSVAEKKNKSLITPDGVRREWPNSLDSRVRCKRGIVIVSTGKKNIGHGKGLWYAGQNYIYITIIEIFTRLEIAFKTKN